MGYAEESCNWDTSGEFPIPCQSVIADKAESLRRVHDYLDTKGKPDVALGTELFADVCAQHVDFVHNIYGSGRPSFFMDWIRYAFPEVVLSDREIRDDNDYAMYLLEEAHVATVKGSAFSAPGYIRLSYATSEDNIREAMRRIRVATEALK